MSAVGLLADLALRGVQLEARDDRLVVDAPADVLTDADVAQLKAAKVDLLSVLRRGSPVDAYHDALRTVWQLTAAGADADPGECRRALGAVEQLIREVGERSATKLRHQWERDWWRDTGRCPRCGEPENFHGAQPV